MKPSIVPLFILSVFFCSINCAHHAKNQEKKNLLLETQKLLNLTDPQVQFQENKGQIRDINGNPVPFVLFKAEMPGLNILITNIGITFQTIRIEEEEEEANSYERLQEEKIIFHWERVDLELKGATIRKEMIIPENPSQVHFNYFYPHCPDGIYGVKDYGKITIKDVYPGIDWVLSTNREKGLKHEFVVHPGADYRQIQLLYRSKSPLKIKKEGELELLTQYGTIKESAPVSFYGEEEVKTQFKLINQKPVVVNGDPGYETILTFESSLPSPLNGKEILVIDPQLYWATFYGGSTGQDGPMSIATDGNGNLFITGYTLSSDFPVQNAGTYFQGSHNGSDDIFLLKFDNGGILIWGTYYGGSSSEDGYSIAVDNNGNIFVTGYTGSNDFPTQPNGGAYYQSSLGGGIGFDAFILKFDNDGNRLWATYYGGSDVDKGYSLATDPSGNVFVTGETKSTDLPTQDAGTFYQGGNNGQRDLFILKFNNTGVRQWATYYGGSNNDYGYAIATDNNGNIFITGTTQSTNFPLWNAGTFYQSSHGGGWFDAFILKFNNAGSREWATYYGGNSNDYGYSIRTDNGGNVFVTGRTNSSNFPTQNAGTFYQSSKAGGYDAFILKFDNGGTRQWATYYGGSGDEYTSFSTYDNIAIDKCGNVYLVFETTSNPFPYLQTSCDMQYYDGSYNGGSYDLLLSLFNNTGSLLWCSYLGGNGDDFRAPLAIDPNNNLFVSGEWTTVTNSATYPVTDPGGGAYYDPTFSGGGDDGFIAKFCSNACICSPYDGCVIFLPVTLLSFSATCLMEGEKIKLEWVTASEQGCEYFEIERQNEKSSQWEKVGKVNCSGNSTTIRTYEYIDEAPSFEGRTYIYYRLRQVDYSGEESYSSTIEITCKEGEEWAFVFHALPVQDRLLGNLYLPEGGKVEFLIYDLQGRVVYRTLFHGKKGSNSVNLSLEHLGKGSYFLQIRQGARQIVKYFVKER